MELHPAAPATPGALPDDASLLASARRALGIEARAVEALSSRLTAAFAAACRICLDCHGRVVVTGMGKSGHVGGKIAATLASTGTPAFFLHPAEAGHGDLGMITRADTVLALSNSGETPELVVLLPHLKRLAVPLIVMTGKGDSTLGRAASVTLDVGVDEEACPLNLAPTASTTATLAMGDALAVALLEARGFSGHFFVTANFIGTRGFVGRGDIRELARRGHVVGSHSEVAGEREVGRAAIDAAIEPADRRQRQILEPVDDDFERRSGAPVSGSREQVPGILSGSSRTGLGDGRRHVGDHAGAAASVPATAR